MALVLVRSDQVASRSVSTEITCMQMACWEWPLLVCAFLHVALVYMRHKQVDQPP